MKNAIEWIKTNPIVTASAVVAFLGLLTIAYFYVVAAPSYSAAKSEVLKTQKQRLDRLMNIAVPLPNEDPNAPPDIYPVVVNQTVINDVGEIYSEIKEQYESILISAEDKNAANHLQVLLGGGNIWPDANPTQFFDLYVRAAADYKDHFKAVFDYGNANNWNMPRMVASSPPTPREIESLLAQSAFDYVSSVGAQSATDLTQTQAQQLFAEQRMRLMGALTQRARSIHLYAQLPAEEDPFAPDDATDDGSAAAAPAIGDSPFGAPPAAARPTNDAPGQYPFRIAPWAYSDQPPTPDQLWEGQVQLWILRDVMSAISEINNVGQTVKAVAPDGSIREEPACVLNSPVKRLLKLQTLPGYVGLHNTGAALLSGSTDFDATTPARSAGRTPIDAGGGLTGTQTPSIYPTPPIELAPKEATDRAIEHFGITPTGRVSNSVFDVRHTQLVIDIEHAKLPAFMEQLRETNYIAVVKTRITDVDEYELLREGYVYGGADVVRAELVLESLWFRNWTAELMPKIVKQKLLIIQPEPATEPGGFGVGQ